MSNTQLIYGKVKEQMDSKLASLKKRLIPYSDRLYLVKEYAEEVNLSAIDNRILCIEAEPITKR